MSAFKYNATEGFVRKYEQCPYCGSKRIRYVYLFCSNGSIQYRYECNDCGRWKPVPHMENSDKDRIAQNHRSAWAYMVRKRDGFACRICRSTDGVEAHHIVPWDADESQRYNPDNGITLCRKHHDAIHAWRKIHGEECGA